MRNITPRPVPEWLPPPLRSKIEKYNAESRRLDAECIETAQMEYNVRTALTEGNGDPRELATQLQELKVQRLQLETNRLHHVQLSADFNGMVKTAAADAMSKALERLDKRKSELEHGFDKLGVRSRYRQGCLNETLHAERMAVAALRVPPDYRPHADELTEAKERVKAAM